MKVLKSKSNTSKTRITYPESKLTSYGIGYRPDTKTPNFTITVEIAGISYHLDFNEEDARNIVKKWVDISVM